MVFFFQAEDGIRDRDVTGVQTCALPIFTGGWFAPAQGGVFAPGETGELVERLRAWGAVGVGQSSWGPALYGIAGDPGASRALAERVRAAVGAGGLVYEGGFSVGGARVWREGSAGSGPKGGSSPGD